MITTRIAAAFVAGALAVGLAAGTAGTMIAKDATASQTATAACIDHMDDMDSVMTGQNGTMSGSGGMMGGGSGGMMGGAGMMSGLNGSGSMPDWMQQHHVAATPAPVQ
jgi:hypothetical protein